jgi:histidine triad (HIT) family protein
MGALNAPLQKRHLQEIKAELSGWSSKQGNEILSSCVFCDIVSGKEKSYSIYEDDMTMAFLTLHPISEGHTLVIPKKHFEMIFDIPQPELSHLIEITKKLCLHYQQKIGMDSLNLIVSNGEATHQKIMHFHLHIIPRKENDGLEFWLRPDEKPDSELEQIRRKFATD